MMRISTVSHDEVASTPMLMRSMGPQALHFSISLIFVFGILLFLISAMSCSENAKAIVSHVPNRPDHEDQISITYRPEPGDNTSVVRLHYIIDDSTDEVVDMTLDPSTSEYAFVVGAYAPGTSIRYAVTAWNRTVGGDNVTVASIVEMAWHKDLEEAIGYSKVLGRPLLVFFYNDRSDDSLRMMATTFDDVRVLNLSASFVVVKIDVDEEVELSKNSPFEVESLPTVVFMDVDLLQIYRTEGHRGSDLFLKDMKHALGMGPRPKEEVPALDPQLLRYPISAAVALLMVIVLMVLLIRRRNRFL